jgi:hypothetical protein
MGCQIMTLALLLSYPQNTDSTTTEQKMSCCSNECLLKHTLSKQVFFLSKVNNGALIRSQ